MKVALVFLCIFISIGTNLLGQNLSMREILAKYMINGFDVPGGTDKDTLHSYIESYAELLEPFRNTECNLLEIGVQYGGSSLLWHDYLPHAKLYLMDIQNIVPEKINMVLNRDRVRFEIMDAYRPEAVSKMKKICPEGFDIIIDDGDHALTSQLFLVQNYLGLLKKGGVMIIEDLQNDQYFRDLMSQIDDDYIAEARDLRHVKGRKDDLLLILKRKNH